MAVSTAAGRSVSAVALSLPAIDVSIAYDVIM